MVQLLVRNLDDDVMRRLEDRARQHGRSVEEEVCDILRQAVMSKEKPVEPLGERFRLLFEGIGLEEDIPELRGQSPSARALAEFQGLISEGIESGVSPRSMEEILEIAREVASRA